MSKLGRYRSRKNGIKGPVFSSFFNQQTSGSHKSYLTHSKLRAVLRNLRHECHSVLKTKDETTLTARRRLTAAVAGEPEPVYAELHLMRAALEAANGTGVTWAESMNYLLDKFDHERHMTGSVQAYDPSFQGEDHGKQGSSDSRDGARRDEQDQLGTRDRQEGGGLLSGASA